MFRSARRWFRSRGNRRCRGFAYRRLNNWILSHRHAARIRQVRRDTGWVMAPYLAAGWNPATRCCANLPCMCRAPDRNIWTSIPHRGNSWAKTQDVEAGFARFATGVANPSCGPSDGRPGRRLVPQKDPPAGRADGGNSSEGKPSYRGFPADFPEIDSIARSPYPGQHVNRLGITMEGCGDGEDHRRSSARSCRPLSCR